MAAPFADISYDNFLTQKFCQVILVAYETVTYSRRILPKNLLIVLIDY